MEYREFWIVQIHRSEDDFSYGFNLDMGRFISNKGRLCALERAREFDSEKEAKIHGEEWIIKKDYVYEIQGFTQGAKPIIQSFSYLSLLSDEKVRKLGFTVSSWEKGRDPKDSMSKNTYYIHKKELLVLGIDISVPCKIKRFAPKPIIITVRNLPNSII